MFLRLQMPLLINKRNQTEVFFFIFLPSFLFSFLSSFLPSFFLSFFFLIYVFISYFFGQGFSANPWLSWNLLCRLGWSQTQRSPCLFFCLPSAGIKAMRYHQLAFVFFLILFIFSDVL